MNIRKKFVKNFMQILEIANRNYSGKLLGKNILFSLNY